MNKYITYLLILCSLAFGLMGCEDDDTTPDTGTATIAFATSVLKTMENVTPLQIPVTLNTPAKQDIQVTVAIKSEEGAKENIHYQFQSKVITIAKGASIGYFFVNLTDDRDINPDRIFTVELMQATRVAIAAEGYTCRIVIQSDEGFPGIGFKNTLMSAPEEQDLFKVPVVLSKKYAEPVTFKVAVKEGGTALPDLHFHLDQEKIYTIPAGDTIVNIDLHIVDNDTVNENTVFELRIIEAQNASITEIYQECKVTIVNDERDAYVSFARTNTQAFESDGYIWIPIKISGVYKLPVKVTIAVEDGSAIQGRDYEVETHEITFENDKMLDSIRIKVIDNTITDIDKYFIVSIAEVKGALKAEKDQEMQATILNDDINLKTLYDNMMGSWTITQSRSDVDASTTMIISGGDTPDEEDTNYQKFLFCRIPKYRQGYDVTWKMSFDPATGEMKVITGNIAIKETIDFGGELGVTNIILLPGTSDYYGFDPNPVSITSNKNFTELIVDPQVVLYGMIKPVTAEKVSPNHYFALENVVMKKNK